jgi:hypothetical protein
MKYIVVQEYYKKETPVYKDVEVVVKRLFRKDLNTTKKVVDHVNITFEPLSFRSLFLPGVHGCKQSDENPDMLYIWGAEYFHIYIKEKVDKFVKLLNER